MGCTHPYINENMTIERVTRKEENTFQIITVHFKLCSIPGKQELAYKKAFVNLLDEPYSYQDDDYYIRHTDLESYSKTHEEDLLYLAQDIRDYARPYIQETVDEIINMDATVVKPPIRIITEYMTVHPTKGEAYAVDFAFGDSPHIMTFYFLDTALYRSLGLYTIEPSVPHKDDNIHFTDWEEYVWEYLRAQSEFRLAFEVLA